MLMQCIWTSARRPASRSTAATPSRSRNSVRKLVLAASRRSVSPQHLEGPAPKRLGRVVRMPLPVGAAEDATADPSWPDATHAHPTVCPAGRNIG
jgi:hypothetical protein